MKDDEVVITKDIRIRTGTLDVLIILVVAILLLSFIVGIVSAVNVPLPPTTPFPTPTETAIPNATVNVTATPTPEPTPAPTPTPEVKIRRIEQQGACVELGETIDISGIGWYTGYISYYGKYRTMTTEGISSERVKVYEVKPWEHRRYFIDPALFKDYPGMWYTFYDKDEVGNAQLFKVSVDGCAFENKTPVIVENKTVVITGLTTLPPKIEEGYDFIISRNTQVKTNATTDSHFWMFGNYNLHQYDIPIDANGTMVFSKSLTNAIPAGSYRIIFVSPGANKIIEEEFDEDNNTISSPFRDVVPVSLGVVGVTTPENQEKMLLDRVSKSIDDTASLMTVLVQDPYVELRQLEQLSDEGKTAVTMAGYTNDVPGSNVTIRIDADKIDPKLSRQNTWTTTVDTAPQQNAYRTWSKTILLDLNEYTPDQHTITLTTDSGAFVNAPLFIRRELPEHAKPETYVQYIGSNPFVPTPTPIVITETVQVIETKIEKEYIEIPVDYDTLAKEVVNKALPYVIAGIICVIVAVYVLYVLARAYMEERRKKKLKKFYETTKKA